MKALGQYLYSNYVGADLALRHATSAIVSSASWFVIAPPRPLELVEGAVRDEVLRRMATLVRERLPWELVAGGAP